LAKEVVKKSQKITAASKLTAAFNRVANAIFGEVNYGYQAPAFV